MADKKEEPTRKILGKPVALLFDDNALKVRRNLLIFSTLAIFIYFTGISVNPDSSISGIHFDGLTQNHVIVALLIVTGYHFIHFMWFSIEAFIEWRLRLTGMKTLRNNSFGNPSNDHSEDPRQSTLYNWWLERANTLLTSIETLNATEKKLTQYRTEIEQNAQKNNVFLEPLEKVNTLIHFMQSLVVEYEGIRKAIHDERIIESLASFEGWFIFFQNSQCIRWLIIECLLPTALGIVSLILLTINLCL